MKRFLSLILLLLGLVIIGTEISMFLGQGIAESFAGSSVVPVVICSILGPLFTFLGIFCLIRLNKKQRSLSDEEAAVQKKKNKRVYITTAVVTLTITAFICVACGWTDIERAYNKRQLEAKENAQTEAFEVIGIDPNIEVSGSAELPENAKYIIYNADKSLFELEPNHQLLDNVTSKAKKASVLVRYRITSEKIGTWVNNYDNPLADAYEDTMHIEVIDIKELALIDSTDITKERKYEDSSYITNYGINIYTDEVIYYLNHLFD